MRQLKKQQSGFTLVEIAIVLVIVGILLGGVLQGQQMIENSRIKGIVNDMNGISAASNSYFDRYRALAGDEPLVRMQARGWNLVTINGNNNGLLDTGALANTFNNPAAERVGFFQALRASGFITGNSGAIGLASLPTSSTGGLMSVAVGAYGLNGTQVCAAALTTRQASGVDGIIDGAGALNNTGSAMAAQGAGNLAPTAVAPPATPYNETVAGNWTLCRSI